RTSSTANTKWSRACPSRSTCWSRKSARWRSTWSWKSTEGLGTGDQGLRAAIRAFQPPDPGSRPPVPLFPLPENPNERPSEPVQPAAPGARLRRDQDRAGLAGPDPLVVLRRSEEARDHQLPYLQARARRPALRRHLRAD